MDRFGTGLLRHLFLPVLSMEHQSVGAPKGCCGGDPGSIAGAGHRGGNAGRPVTDDEADEAELLTYVGGMMMLV